MGPLTQSDWIAFGSLGLALAFVIGAYARMRWGSDSFNVRLSDGMGNPSWDFTNSWATTLTAVEVVLGTVLSAVALTDPKRPTGLNLFFGILVVLAPFLFTALSLRRVSSDGTGDPSAVPEYQGWVGTYLLACLLTLWGVCGALITSVALLSDLTSQGYLSTAVDWVFGVCLIVAVLGLALYALRTIPATVQAQQSEHARKAKAQLELRAAAPGGTTGAGTTVVPPSLSRWALL